MKDDTQINTTKRTRTPKQSTGTMLWIPATCLTEVKAIVDRDTAMRKAQATEKLRQRVQRDTERLKALATDATENQQLTSIGVNPVIDSTQNVPEQVHETLPEPTQEYLTPIEETPITGFKQAEWCVPAIVPPNQQHVAYDGSTSINQALGKLFGYSNTKGEDIVSGAVGNKWTWIAKVALDIDPSIKVTNEQKAEIYQWFVDNPGQWPKV